jgi:outer membrane lipoprotein-sorting protein
VTFHRLSKVTTQFQKGGNAAAEHQPGNLISPDTGLALILPFERRWPILRYISIVLSIIVTCQMWMGCSGNLRRPVISEEEMRLDAVPEVLRHNFERLKTLKGRGKLTIETPRFAYTADSRVIFKGPDSLYIRLEAIFGIDIGWLFADRDSFTAFTPFTNSYFAGSTDSLKFGPLANFDMTYDRLIQTLTGLATVPELQDGRLERSDKKMILSGVLGGSFLTYWIDPAKGVVTKVEMKDQESQVLLLGEFQRFVKLSGIYLPRTIRMQRPQQQEAITLFYENLEVNKRVSKKDFKTRIPESASKMTLRQNRL